jgi:microcystin-dependent protein
MSALTRAHLFRDDGTDVLMVITCVPLPFSRLALALVDSYWVSGIGLSDQEQATIDRGVASLMESMANSSQECNKMIGMIVAFPSPGNLPQNVLACNGTQYDKDMWPKLYEYLGTETLPDLSNRFLLSSGLRNPGVTGGEDSHTLSTNELPQHTHVYTSHSQVDVQEGKGVTVSQPAFGVTGSAGTGQAHNNMPPYMVVKYGIVAA